MSTSEKSSPKQGDLSGGAQGNTDEGPRANKSFLLGPTWATRLPCLYEGCILFSPRSIWPIKTWAPPWSHSRLVSPTHRGSLRPHAPVSPKVLKPQGKRGRTVEQPAVVPGPRFCSSSDLVTPSPALNAKPRHHQLEPEEPRWSPVAVCNGSWTLQSS